MEETILALLDGGEEGRRALLQLQLLGMPAVKRLISMARTADPGASMVLSSALPHLHVPGMLEEMVPLLSDTNADLSLAAYDWLAQTKESGATKVLLDVLSDEARSLNERWLAAEALGSRGEFAVLPELRRVASRVTDIGRDAGLLREQLDSAGLDDSALRFLIKLAVAEARLGGEELSALPVAIACLKVSTDRDSIVRVEAVSALASVAAAGCFEALVSALGADDIEVATSAMEPLRLLGERRVVDVLVDLVAQKHPELGELSLSTLVAITGPGIGEHRSVFDLAPDEIRNWWQGQISKYSPGVCYRRGVPFELATLVALLKDPAERDTVAREFFFITGISCGFDPEAPPELQDEVATNAERALAGLGTRFLAGKYYKYGNERNLAEAMRTGVLGPGV